MRILFNGLTALKPRTGIGQYCVRLADAAAKLLPAGAFDVYPTPRLRNVVSKSLGLMGGKSTGVGGPVSLKQKVRGRIVGAMKNLGQTATALHFRRHAAATNADLIHEPNYLPFDTGRPTVITVHDLSVLLHPEWHPADRVRQHEHKLRRAVTQAAHIITDTEQVKSEIIRELGTHAAKISAVHLGVGPEYHPVSDWEQDHWRQQLQLPRRWLLAVGTIEPRKNLLTAMQAFTALPGSIREACPLLLAGPWGWRADAERRYYDDVGRHAGIRHLGYIPDAALPALYTGAAALLYPSLYEGFGLPPLEANACGTPVLASAECLAVREVMGAAARYLPATDIAAWRDALQKNDLLHTARIAERFTWTAAAAQTIAVYQNVLSPTVALRAAA